MARQADFGFYDGPDENGIPRDSLVGMKAITRFAALIEQRAAATEREACARVCERVADDYIAANGRHAAAIAYECAVAIRARGEKP